MPDAKAAKLRGGKDLGLGVYFYLGANLELTVPHVVAARWVGSVLRRA